MKIIFIENRLETIKKLREKINLNEYLKHNKLVLISEYFYNIDDNPTNISKYYGLNAVGDNIMLVALGNLSKTIKINGFNTLNYGLGLKPTEIIEGPINYYQRKYKEQVEEISFYCKHPLYVRLDDYQILKNYLFSLNIKNEEVLDFKPVNVSSGIKRIRDNSSKKLTFVPGESIYYGFKKDNYSLDKIKSVTSEYLKDGNILCILTYTGNHYGYPFAVEKDRISIFDTSQHEDEYLRLLKYFRSLNINKDQVSNFKISYTGFNLNSESYNFGFDWDNVDSFFVIYLNYLKHIGYNINDIYLLDRSKGSYTSENTKTIKSLYKLNYIKTQDECIKQLKKINKI